jgi:hypothetical protein
MGRWRLTTGQAAKFRPSRLARPGPGSTAGALRVGLRLINSGSCPQCQGASGKTLFERPWLARGVDQSRSPLSVPETGDPGDKTSLEARTKHVSGIWCVATLAAIQGRERDTIHLAPRG